MDEQVFNIVAEQADVPSEKNFHCYYQSIATYSKLSTKTYIGNQDYVCRFCGQTDRKKFKKDNAHTFPESLGNRHLFSRDECVDCNSKFSRYENELAAFGHITRSLFGIKKKNKPNPKFKNDSISIKKENETIKMSLIIDENIDHDSEKNGEVIISHDFETNRSKAQVSIPEQGFIPLYLFKSLCKIAFSLMPTQELNENKFEKLKSLLAKEKDSFDNEQYLPYFHIYHNRFSLTNRPPLLMLFKKDDKYKEKPLPMYSFLFAYANHIYQIFLPLVDEDNWLLEQKEILLPLIPEVLSISDGKGKCTWMNGHSLDRKKFKNMNFSATERKK